MVNKYDKVVRSDPRSPRYFKACDVARIAENCVDDTGTPEYIVMACVAKRLGYARVWVDDKDEALQTDAYDREKALQRFYEDTSVDLDREFFQTTGENSYQRIFLSVSRRLAQLAENEIAVDTMSFVQAIQYGYEGWLNWILYQVLKVFNSLPLGIFNFISRPIMAFIQWVGGLVDGVITIVSVDVDDVLRANPDWCTCEQPDLANFEVDAEAAEEFDKSLKKRKKGGGKKEPINVPNPVT